ncbi:MAG TPA: hypothetical protein DDW65_06635 [Firmicutes bacterium]|nr:hypothetical protein [Bacillota bacterium]
MIVSTQRSLALRCPLCGRLEHHSISFFDFSGNVPVKVTCKCGFNKLIINTKNYKEFYLQMSCLICEDVHILKFTRAELWEKSLAVLRCTETGQELGYIGDETVLMKIIKQKQNDIESIMNNLGFDDYFTNPPIMFEVLKHLHQIAELNQMFCLCGNSQIEIDVYPEKLELHCPICQSLHIIYAETIEDLQIVKQVNSIALTEKGFTSFDASKVHPSFKP